MFFYDPFVKKFIILNMKKSTYFVLTAQNKHTAIIENRIIKMNPFNDETL